MSYTIQYKDGPAGDLQALCDFRAYVGEKRWASLGLMFFPASLWGRPADVKTWLKLITVAAMLAGVQGRPVRAYKRAWLATYPISRRTHNGRLLH